MRDASTLPRTIFKPTAKAVPEVVVAFVDDAEASHLAEDLVRALARQIARDLFASRCEGVSVSLKTGTTND